MRDMKEAHLGQEIRRLRLEAGITLRALATRLEISAAHLSDVEHNRRRPSEKLLRKIAHELRTVGATFESLERLVTGIDPKTREWAASTPGARALLRAVLESGQDPREILQSLERINGRKASAKARKAGRKASVNGRKAR
jgi:transcriptional regulator with XRE-family HTH domain